MIIYALALTASFLFLFSATMLYRYVRLKHHAQHVEKELAAFTEFTTEITRINHTDLEAKSAEMVDALTGLPNRELFEDRLDQVLNQGQRLEGIFAIMALDVDNFSEVCELGSDIGDKLLKELAMRLQMSSRQIDSITRFGGAYFLFLLPVLYRPETAIYVAQRVQDNLLESFVIDGHEIKITVSIGISVYPVDGIKSIELIKNASEAMRQAKVAGKNKYQFCQSELHDLGTRELSIAKLIRSDEFLKHLRIQYKPFFNVENNKPFYIQATCHLYHPQYGMISLETITNITENSGRMLEVNEWVLKAAIDKLKIWAKDGFKPVHLAMPVSMKQLENSHFVYKVTEIAGELKHLSTQLVLEIADDALPQNLSFIEKLFSLLEEADIKICIGVLALGHFAMQKFNRIPLHYLKIDNKLIKAATENQEKDIILSRIVQVAHDENVVVMAEGVDKEIQKQALIKIGCNMMEGELFGYLMPSGSILQKTE